MAIARIVPQDFKPDVAAISALLQQSDNPGALSLANKALKVAPHNCAILTLKGVALEQLHNTDTALAMFQSALRYCPRYIAALEGAAQIEFAQKPGESKPLLDRILLQDPGNVTAHAMLATLAHRENDCKKALPNFEATGSLLSSRPDLLDGFGFCLAHEGRLNDALNAYRQESALHTTSSAEFNIALLQWKTNAPDKALETLAPLLNSNYEPAYSLAAHLNEELGNTARAVELLRSAILLKPEDLDNYLDFADIAFQHASFQVGIDILNAGIGRFPDSAVLLVARGVLEVQLGRNDAAILDLERAHRLEPDLSSVTDAMGVMWTQQHDNVRALEFFRSQAQLHPDDPFLHFLLAEQLSESRSNQEQDDLQAAIMAAKAAVKIDPRYTAAHDLLAKLYVQTGLLPLAITESQEALAEDPHDQMALYQEIMAYRKSGDSARARSLVAHLQEIKKEVTERKQLTDRYQLQEEVSAPPPAGLQ